MEKPATKEYSWEELTFYCKCIYQQMLQDGFIPEVIIAVARGGYFTGLMLSHLFKQQELFSLSTSTNMNDEVRSKRRSPAMKEFFYNIHKEKLEGKKVLIVDDVVNTGVTLKEVMRYMKSLNITMEIRTACMIYDTYHEEDTPWSDCVADYYADKRCAWACFPWEN